MIEYRLSARLPIPIATSSLLQLNSILPLLSPQKSVGILTFNPKKLGNQHLAQVGLSPDQIRRTHIKGPPASGYLRRLVEENSPYSHADIEAELVGSVAELIKEYPDIGAILLECTQMPPFAEAIQRAVRLPVYDVYTLGCWFYSGLARKTPAVWGK